MQFVNDKKKRLRRGILPGNTKSLWTAVNIAKDINKQDLPDMMYLNGELINSKNKPDVFEHYFEKKTLILYVMIWFTLVKGK